MFSLMFCFLVFFLLSVSGNNDSALIIIDVQNDFTSGGSLAVPDGDDVIPVINTIRANYGTDFGMIVTSQDWHTPHHVSFASSFVGLNPYDSVNLSYHKETHLLCNNTLNLEPYFSSNCNASVSCSDDTIHLISVNQNLWPDHCIAYTYGAELKSTLVTSTSDLILYKGTSCQVDSYSVFYDNAHLDPTGLDSILRENGISKIFITGLARDYCCFYSAMDGKSLGYDVYFVWDATRSFFFQFLFYYHLESISRMTSKNLHFLFIFYLIIFYLIIFKF
jgi:nicotinamidase/pyrazinamidase